MKKLLCIFLLPLSLFAQINTQYIEQDRPLNLVEGWNMIGFTCNEPIAVIDAFLPIVDKVLIAKDNNGSVYLPEFGFNGIGFFEYGYGYQLKLTESISDFQFCPFIVPLVEGCMDETAFNYNSSANMDDGSCYPIVLGCLDPSAFNYNDYDNDGFSNEITGINGVDVNTSYGFCLPVVNGCIDVNADNYSTSANTDNGSCLYYGCMDESACNYDTEANTDDGSCEYPQEGYNCDGLDYISILESKYWVVDSAVAEFMAVNINMLESPLITDELPVCSHDDIFYVSENFIVTKYDGLVNCGTDEESLTDLSGSWFVEGNVLTVVQEDGSYFFEVIQANSDTLIIEFLFNFEVNGASEIIPARITLINIIPIFGCTGPLAQNFNPSANLDDGSCQPFIYGCMSPNAINYNPNANTNQVSQNNIDNPCQPYIYGCMSPQALNYNPSANVQQVSENNLDNPCVDIIEGCTHLTACNYNDFATYYDGSCEYAEQGYDCDGNVTAQIGDIFEGGYLFYKDPTNTRGLVAAMEDIGTYEWGCYGIEVNGADGQAIGTGYQNTMDIVNQGCSTENGGLTAAQASLHFESESFDDWYLPSLDELEELNNSLGTFGQPTNIGGFEESMYFSSSEYSNNPTQIAWYVMFLLDISTNYNKGTLLKVRPIRAFGNWTMGCMDSIACNYNPEANMSDGSCTYAEQGGVCPPVCPYEAFLEYSPYSNSYDYSACITPVVMGCMDSIAENFNTEANVEDGSCEYILGCMDNGADNFNQEATQEDNSCIYYGCIDSLANNYDLIANQDDGSCIYYGCTDPEAINYNENANTDNGFCDYFGCMDESADNFDANATVFSNDCIYSGCIEPEADNYDSNANQNDGSCIYFGCTNEMAENYNQVANQDDDSCIIMGCTFDIFPNYNSEANEEDGSCDMSSLVVFGCTDPSYVEFNIYANQNNGTCSVFVVYGCTGADHCNYNPDANTDDGSCIYTQEGYDCDGNITEYIVGMEEEGGIVFYVDETGQHGLVVSMEDIEGIHQWGCYGNDLNGNNYSLPPELETIGTGYQNTLEIVSGCSETPIAASQALAYESGGYDDWYLPSIDELGWIYNTVGQGGPGGNIGGFENTLYWSSSESNGSASWGINFEYGGSAEITLKINAKRVRVIRSF